MRDVDGLVKKHIALGLDDSRFSRVRYNEMFPKKAVSPKPLKKVKGKNK